MLMQAVQRWMAARSRHDQPRVLDVTSAPGWGRRRVPAHGAGILGCAVGVLIMLMSGNLWAYISPDIKSICENTANHWSACATRIIQELESHNLSGSEDHLTLAEIWNTKFAAAYDGLRQNNNLTCSTPDSEKIRQFIASEIEQIQPEQIAMNMAIKRYLKLLSAVLEWTAWPVKSLKASQWSELQTTWDELRLTNQLIQEKLMPRLFDYLNTGDPRKPKWKIRLHLAADAARAKLMPSDTYNGCTNTPSPPAAPSHLTN